MIALTVVTVLIAVIAVAYVMVIARPESSTTLRVTRYDPSYSDPARDAIYLDDELKQEVSTDVGANHTIVFELTLGK